MAIRSTKTGIAGLPVSVRNGGVSTIRSREDAKVWRWSDGVFPGFRRDVRFAVRSLARTPVFSLAVVATLAIGIGATTAIVSYARPILLPQIPYRQPERMVVITNPDFASPQNPSPFPFFSLSDRFAVLRDAVSSFERLGGARYDQLNLLVNGDPAAVSVSWINSDYFELFGGIATCGRLFVPEEYRSRTGDVAVLSWKLWQSRFGANPAIVGTDIELGGRLRRVVGVLPRQFRPANLFNSGDVYLAETPTATVPAGAQGFSWMQVAGRLKPGVTLAQAQGELAGIRFPPRPPFQESYLKSIQPRVAALTAYYRDADRTLIWVFVGAVGFLYAIACSNAASLLLARMVARRRELAVRMAVGGSRGQLLRLLLSESLVLSALAGAAGLVLAQWGAWVLIGRETPAEWTPTTSMWSINLPTLVTVFLVSATTSIVVVAAPALRLARTPLNDALKDGAASMGDSRRLQRVRAALVVLQAALAVTLLAGAGIALQSFWRLQRVSLGFDPANKLAIAGMLPEPLANEAFLSLTTRLRDELARLPGVADVSYSQILPLNYFISPWPLKIDGRPELGEIEFSANAVSADYFDTLRLPLLAGRGFAGLHPGSAPVAVINQTAAKRCFGADDPIGRRIDAGQYGKWEIIGVVADVRENGRRTPVKPQLYRPYWQPPIAPQGLIELIRLTGSPAAGLEAMIRKAAYAVEPRLVVNINSLGAQAELDVKKERRALAVLEVVGGLAVVLAATGLFALMAFIVAQRQREFGVRLALGATPGGLLRLVLWRGLLLTGAGVAVGLGAAWALTRFLASLLYNTSPHDPATYGAVAVGLLVIAAVACWIPARRAARVDPVVALRSE